MYTGTNRFCPPFSPMAEVLREGTVGASSLTAISITERECIMATIGGDRMMYPGDYMQLKINGQLVMSDTPYERLTNRDLVGKAFGDVLIGGLGIGMILVPLINNPAVTSVTVIECNQDVVDLVAPQLPLTDEVSIICADINTWEPPPNRKYTTIYFDIWPTICSDNYEEMKALHRRYKKYVNYKVGGFMDSWCKDDVRRLYNGGNY